MNGHYLPKDRSSLGTAMFFHIRKLFSHISMMAVKKTKWSSLSLLAHSAVNKTVIAPLDSQCRLLYKYDLFDAKYLSRMKDNCEEEASRIMN